MKNTCLRFAALGLLLTIILYSCKKDNQECDYCPLSYVSETDPDFIIAPTANAWWDLSFHYYYTDYLTEITNEWYHWDSVYIGTPYSINTKTILQTAASLNDVLPESPKTYYPLVSKFRTMENYQQDITFGNGIDTITYYRVDTVNKILYEVFTLNNETYEDPVFDLDFQVGDTVKYYYNTGFSKTVIHSRDSVLLNNRYYPRFNSLILGNIRFFRHINLLSSSTPFGMFQQIFYYKTDSINLF